MFDFSNLNWTAALLFVVKIIVYFLIAVIAMKLVVAALQKRPELAENFQPRVPVCDWSLCTMCGECAKACPLHACDLDASGHFSVEPAYCVGCEACMIACPECCIEMEPCSPQELVIPDEDAEKLAERRAMVARDRSAARAASMR